MTTTYTAFTPSTQQNFSFQPTLDGQQYNVVFTWSFFGRRWIMNVYTLQGAIVVRKPLRSSPDDYDINLLLGYFTTTLVYRDSTNMLEVTS